MRTIVLAFWALLIGQIIVYISSALLQTPYTVIGGLIISLVILIVVNIIPYVAKPLANSQK